ncbi:hypothetical protein [Roseivivax sp. CAU 1761]
MASYSWILLALLSGAEPGLSLPEQAAMAGPPHAARAPLLLHRIAAAAETDAQAMPAAGSKPAAPEGGAEAAAAAPEETGPWPALDLPALAAAPYLETRTRLLEGLAETQAGARGAQLQDLAELHLAHGLLTEARSFLAASARDGSGDPARGAALRAALEAFLPERARGAVQASGSAREAWPDAPIYDALAMLSAGGETEYRGLSAALDALPRLSPALQERALPLLLEHAVLTERWREARLLAERFEAAPVLRDLPVYHYLLGRVAEAGGEDVAAFDSYRRAAEGRDAAAQRARLQLLALGGRTGTLTPEERTALLAAARRQWQGGRLGRQLLEAQAEAAQLSGDRVAALAVLHDLATLHPDTLAAQKARAAATALLEEIYADGAAGRLPLAEFMAAHQRLARDYRMAEAFGPAAERYAATLRARGITAAAAAEYAAIREHLEVAQDLGLSPPDPLRRDRLRLAEAEALIAGGRYAEATVLLGPPLAQEDDGHAARRAQLRAEAFRGVDDLDALMAEADEAPSPRMLRLKGDAHFQRGEWAEAFAAYEALWAEDGEALGEARNLRMLLAAHRAGLDAALARLAAAMPGTASAAPRLAIAAGLAAERPALAPLRREVIEAEMAGAAAAVERVRTLADPGGGRDE